MAVWSGFLITAALTSLLAEGVLTLSFSAEPIDTIVAAGSSVMLPCAADQQDSTVQHAWYRNGNPVSLGDVFNLATDGSLKISVPEATTAYEQFDGLYHCIMSNVSHQLRSKHASILVSRSTTAGEFGGTNGQRLVPTEEDTVAVTQEGYFVPDEAAWNIACSSSPHETRQCPSRDCNLDYKLYPIDRQKSKSVLLMTLDQLRALTEEENCWSFILSSAWEKDQGKNFLQAFFKGMQSVPRRIVLPTDTTVKAGSDVTLPCLANEDSSYLWYKNNVPVSDKAHSRISFVDGSLHIKAVRQEDAGTYECVAGIQPHHGKATFNLAVHSLPTVKMSLIKTGSQLTVTCTVTGTAPLTTEILLDGVVQAKKIMDDSSKDLVHTISSAGDRLVQCIASNQYGSAQTNQNDKTATVKPTLTTTVKDITTSTPNKQGSTGAILQTEHPSFQETESADETEQPERQETEQPERQETEQPERQETEQPTVRAGRPRDNTEKPPVQGGESGDKTEQPDHQETEQPTVRGGGPGDNTENPPVQEGGEPDDKTKHPADDTVQPVDQGEKPADKTEQPRDKDHTRHDVPTAKIAPVIDFEGVSQNDKSSGGFSDGAAIGIAVVVIVVISVLVVGLVLWRKRQSKVRVVADLMAGKYGTVQENPTYQDMDEIDLQDDKQDDDKPADGGDNKYVILPTRVEFSTISVDHDTATIAIGAETTPAATDESFTVLDKSFTVLNTTADHYTAEEDIYATTTKKPKRQAPKSPDDESEVTDSDSHEGMDSPVLHYQMGDEVYALPMRKGSSHSLLIPKDEVTPNENEVILNEDADKSVVIPNEDLNGDPLYAHLDEMKLEVIASNDPPSTAVSSLV